MAYLQLHRLFLLWIVLFLVKETVLLFLVINMILSPYACVVSGSFTCKSYMSHLIHSNFYNGFHLLFHGAIILPCLWYLYLFGLRGLFSLVLGYENGYSPRTASHHWQYSDSYAAINDTRRMMHMGGFSLWCIKMYIWEPWTHLRELHNNLHIVSLHRYQHL